MAYASLDVMAHYSSAFMNGLFNDGNSEYLTLTGSRGGGSIVVRISKSTPDDGYDAFRGVYDTAYMQSNGFSAAYVRNTDNLNPLPIESPVWIPEELSARTASPGTYHYLPDDLTTDCQWLFRESGAFDLPWSDVPDSRNVPSLLMIR